MNEFATRQPHHWESDSHIRVPTQPSQILLWISDADGRATFMGPSWMRYTGRKRDALLGNAWYEAVHTEDVPALMRAFRQSAMANQGFRRKLRMRRNDGVYCGMVIESLPQIDDDGKLYGFAGFCLDLSPAEHSLLAPNLADHRITDLFQHIRLPALALDIEGNIIYFNQPFLDIVGEPAREVICTPLFGQYASLDNPDIDPRKHLREIAESSEHVLECRVAHADGTARLISWHVTSLHHRDSQMSCLILIGEDITSQKAAEEQLLLTRQVFDSTEQAMVVTDADVRIISVNAAFTRLTGYSVAEALGQNPRILQSGRHGPAFYAQMWATLSRDGNWHGDIWDRRKDGSFYPKFLSISAIRNQNGEITNYCGIIHDISERKRIEEDLDRLAHYDPLTGIPNRALFFERIGTATANALRTGSEVAILFVDMDRFKAVNDTLGHHAGDQLLRQVAERIGECLRGDDTVARLGGDEFGVLLPDVRDRRNAARVAEKIIERLCAPFLIEGVNCEVSPSIGISLYPSDHHDPEFLLQLADRAMYQVKTAGRGSYRFFEDLPRDDSDTP